MLTRLVLTVLSGVTFTMCQGGDVPAGCCQPDDQLNVVMGPKEAGPPLWDARDQCDRMGGHITWDQTTTIAVCEDVDH